MNAVISRDLRWPVRTGPSLSPVELLGATVRDATGTVRGRVREMAVAPQDHPTRIAYLIVKTPGGEHILSSDGQVVR